MINRYQGNSGKVSRYAGPGEPGHGSRGSGQSPPPRKEKPREQSLRSPNILGSLENLGKLLPERIGELETEDIILLLILYLMYRESGDSELLIIMGAMFLL